MEVLLHQLLPLFVSSVRDILSLLDYKLTISWPRQVKASWLKSWTRLTAIKGRDLFLKENQDSYHTKEKLILDKQEQHLSQQLLTEILTLVYHNCHFLRLCSPWKLSAVRPNRIREIIDSLQLIFI